MAKTGRPKIPIDLVLLEKLCLIQCTDTELAAMLNVSIETIDKRKQSDPEFLQIYKKGKEEGKMSLRRKMYEMANAGHAVMCIWLSKQYLGMTEKTEHSGSFVMLKPQKIEKDDEGCK